MVSGPVPKRSSERRRRSSPAVPIESAAPVSVRRGPELGLEGSHPLAVEWYEGLRESRQSVYFEPSDWQTARVWAELLSRALWQGMRPSAQLISAWQAGATELLTTEGARRRLRLELERDTADEDEDAAVAAIDEYRARLG